jgi:hypothetical protein
MEKTPGSVLRHRQALVRSFRFETHIDDDMPPTDGGT